MAQAHDPRHQLAAKRAERLDRAWFDRRPERFVRLRSSLAFEREGWSERSHIDAPFTIAMRAEDGDIAKLSFFARQKPEEDVATLAVIWDALCETLMQSDGSGMIDLSQVKHHEMAARVGQLKRKLARPSVFHRGAS